VPRGRRLQATLLTLADLVMLAMAGGVAALWGPRFGPWPGRLGFLGLLLLGAAV
jgi:hypothetical protein